MKKEDLRKYFNQIKELTNGDNTSDYDIIDYKNGYSISINELDEEYYKYLDLLELIDEYIENKNLDDVIDRDVIVKNFASTINSDLFELNQATLKDFVYYMCCKINLEN